MSANVDQQEFYAMKINVNEGRCRASCEVSRTHRFNELSSFAVWRMKHAAAKARVNHGIEMRAEFFGE